MGIPAATGPALRRTGFVPHGVYKSRFERALVCNDATGPFNVELLQAFALVNTP